MKSQYQIRTAGIIGMAAAGLWIIALVIEYRYGLQPPGDGSTLYVVNQLMFSVAFAGYLTMLLGLWKSNAAGNGRFGKISLGIFITAILLFLIGQVVQLIIKKPELSLAPVGGLLQLIGVLLTGIAVVNAKRWDGWQRFAPLLQGTYYLMVFLFVIISNQGPSEFTEAVWTLTWFITSFALFTKSGNM